MKTPEPVNINWIQLLLNLRKHFRFITVVAKRVGSDERTLNRIIRGETKQPRYDIGTRLLNLHHDELPDLHKKTIIQE